MKVVLKGINGEWIGEGHHPRPKQRLADVHFTVVRNPYERMVSMWKFSGLEIGFDRFVRLLSKNMNPSRNPLLHMTQSEWIKTFKNDKVVHLENLREELEEIVGLVGEIPKLNTTNHKHYTEYLTKNAISNINRWAEEDFKFGYKQFD